MKKIAFSSELYKKRWWVILDPTCQDCGSCHSCPHSKKNPEQCGNQPPSLDPSENWGPGQNTALETGEKGKYRESELAQSRNGKWQQQHVRDLKGSWLAVGVCTWTSLREKISWGPSLRGGLHTVTRFSSRIPTRCSGWRSEKISLMLWAGGWEK